MELTVKADDSKGWASLTLISTVCNRNTEKLLGLSNFLTTQYDQKEISEIWRRVRLLLTKEDVNWLEHTLNQLSLQAS